VAFGSLEDGAAATTFGLLGKMCILRDAPYRDAVVRFLWVFGSRAECGPVAELPLLAAFVTAHVRYGCPCNP